MTLQEAEALAQDTGAVTNVRLHGRWDNTVFTSSELLEFVSLVAARERERCAKVCESYEDWCENWGQYDNHFAANKAADECAAKIRGCRND